MKVIYSSLLMALLSACANTEKAPMTAFPKMNTPQMQLANKAQLYPKDTVALTQLAALHLKQYEARKNLYSLNLVISSYEELLKRQPYNHDVVLQFYRLNLFKGIATNRYDIEHWQEFYQQHVFLKSVDLAPPEYMAILSDPDLFGDAMADYVQTENKKRIDDYLIDNPNATPQDIQENVPQMQEGTAQARDFTIDKLKQLT